MPVGRVQRYSLDHNDTTVEPGQCSGSFTPAVSWRTYRPTSEWPGWLRSLLGCLLFSALVASCARRPAAPPLPSPPTGTQYGLASWYGRERHGQRTASGEPYDSDQLTAAHRTAPFGTYALVTNLANGRTVRVRINDRGPAIAERLLDLSYAAAHQLDMVRAGVTRVKVEWLAAPASERPRSEADLPAPLETYGYTEHLRHVHSFQKLTGEGVTLVGSEMVHILEAVLPTRLEGGSPRDYQLLEEEDAQRFTHLSLVVSPRIALPDETTVIAAVLDALGQGSIAADSAQAIWNQARTLRVKRMEPICTARGKLMPLHLPQRATRTREDEV